MWLKTRLLNRDFVANGVANEWLLRDGVGDLVAKGLGCYQMVAN